VLGGNLPKSKDACIPKRSLETIKKTIKIPLFHLGKPSLPNGVLMAGHKISTPKVKPKM
jgi:hypothetical protein